MRRNIYIYIVEIGYFSVWGALTSWIEFVIFFFFLRGIFGIHYDYEYTRANKRLMYYVYIFFKKMSVSPREYGQFNRSKLFAQIVISYSTKTPFPEYLQKRRAVFLKG